MMSYTMACTSLCSIGGKLMRRTSPLTRIIGGRPEDRCRSEALFLTTKASSSEMSIYNFSTVNGGGAGRAADPGDRQILCPFAAVAHQGRSVRRCFQRV